MSNVCNFIAPNKTQEHIQPINFVYETKTDIPTVLSPSSVYRVHLVTDGEGIVRCGECERTVKKGDVFFAFPAVCESITSTEHLRYLYISYVGIRAGAEMERLGIHYKNFVFEELGELANLWNDAIHTAPELMDLVSESLILYTLSRIGLRELRGEKSEKNSPSVANLLLVKAYIDERFSNPALNCEAIASYFCYNKKYISTLFKKHFQIGIAEYINLVRINNACVLMREGKRSIGEIASAVGFNDPLYFSRVFKNRTGSSPKEFMRAMD